MPPRENALIVESYRNPPNVMKKKRSCCCSTRLLLTLALIVLAIIAIVGITLATLFFIFNPNGPKFSVNNVVVKNTGKSSRPQYEIWLAVKNPNKRLGLDYVNDAEVSLLYEGTKVATGNKFPMLEQDRGAFSNVKVGLTGSNGPLPKVMDKSMNDKESNTPVALRLEMKLGIRVTTAGLESWVMKSDVTCKFKVNSLRNGTKILSQECNTNFKTMLKI